MIKINTFVFLVFLSFFNLSCQSQTDAPTRENKVVSVSDQELEMASNYSYAWKRDVDARTSLRFQIQAPDGFKRVRSQEGSFAEWLRHLPLKPPGTPVYLFNQDEKYNQDVHYAVVDLDTGNRNLQQCADAIMRLKAEYHYAIKDYSQIHFNYTSGHKVAYADWAKGRRPIVKGNKVTFSEANKAASFEYPDFKKYLRSIFNYAGTLSLSKEMKSVPLSEIQIGDVFIQGGSPGHAVLVLDVVENEKGVKRFLLGQSYMPAQDFHILKNPSNVSLSPWYELDPSKSLLQTPEWGFQSTDLKRFK